MITLRPQALDRVWPKEELIGAELKLCNSQILNYLIAKILMSNFYRIYRTKFDASKSCLFPVSEDYQLHYLPRMAINHHLQKKVNINFTKKKKDT